MLILIHCGIVNATTISLQTVYDLEKEGTTLYSLISLKVRMKFALPML